MSQVSFFGSLSVIKKLRRLSDIEFWQSVCNCKMESSSHSSMIKTHQIILSTIKSDYTLGLEAHWWLPLCSIIFIIILIKFYLTRQHAIYSWVSFEVLWFWYHWSFRLFDRLSIDTNFFWNKTFKFCFCSPIIYQSKIYPCKCMCTLYIYMFVILWENQPSNLPLDQHRYINIKPYTYMYVCMYMKLLMS